MPETKNIQEQNQQKTDIELVKMALASQNNFIYLIDRYKNKLRYYIERIANVSPEDAEDILQEVFLKVYLNLNDFDQDLKFSSWIYRITHNQVISFHRKHKARPQGYAIELSPEDLNNMAAELNIEKETDLKLLREKIQHLLFTLDEKYREILVLKFLEEKSYEEISDILKKPVGTVASLLNRAKHELRAKLVENNIKL